MPWGILIVEVLKVIAPIVWGWFLKWLQDRLTAASLKLPAPRSTVFDPGSKEQAELNDADVRALFNEAIAELGWLRIPARMMLSRCRDVVLAHITGNPEAIASAEHELEMFSVTLIAHKNEFK